MRKLLFVVPSLHDSAITTQITLLAQHLPSQEFSVHVAAHRDGPAGARLRASGVQVVPLIAQRRWDLGVWWALRELTKALQPDLIHAWGLPSLRLLNLLTFQRTCPLLVSRPWLPGRQFRRLGWLDRWLLQRADGILVSGPAEEELCRREGFAAHRIVPMPRAFSLESRVGKREAGAGSRLPTLDVLCIGPVERHKNLRDAVWAFDVLHHWMSKPRLGICGQGSGLAELRRFVRALGVEGSVKLLGRCDQVAAWLERTEVVWAPSRVGGGQQAVLEAMAAGRPVVAFAAPGMSELIVPEVTGFLVPPGDKVGMARKTRLLLDNPDLRTQMGQAGREHVRRSFSREQFVLRYGELYRRARW
jgi:glycosyltransferase involved in cell wall biosynthesis